MSEVTHYWPGPDDLGVYDLVHDSGAVWREAMWTGEKWVAKGPPGGAIEPLEVISWGYLGVRREAEKPKPAVDPMYYWPGSEEGGRYLVHVREKYVEMLDWDGSLWRSIADPEESCTTESLVSRGYLGVHRKSGRPIIARVTLRDGGEHKPPRNALSPDTGDGNAMVAQQALDEWRAVKQAPKAADWAYRWAVDLCERLGAR